MLIEATSSLTDDQEQYMLSACSSGDVIALQRLFSIHGIAPGSPPIFTQCVNGTYSRVESKLIPGYMIPSAMELLETAVAARQLAIVEFIFRTYPQLKLSEGQNIACAIIEHPDATILKSICDHDPTFASLTMDYGFRTFFTQACEQPPAQIAPVLHVLLDYGADIDDGWGAGGGALWAAIIGGQPTEIIRKVLICHSSQHVPISDRQVNAAIARGDEDIVALLFSSGKISFKAGVAEKYINQAEKKGDTAIIALVKDWAEKKAAADSDMNKLWATKSWQKVLRFIF